MSFAVTEILRDIGRKSSILTYLIAFTPFGISPGSFELENYYHAIWQHTTEIQSKSLNIMYMCTNILEESRKEGSTKTVD